MLPQRNFKPFFFVTSALCLFGMLFFVTRIHVASNAVQVKPFESDHSAARLKQYKILIWDFQKSLDVRYLFATSDNETVPFASCAVRNCVLETSNTKVFEAHAIIFHMHRTAGPHTLPKFRKPGQYWVFFSIESPLHTFNGVEGRSRYSISDYNGLFNLTMTYRSDSDVPVPYGRAVRLHHPPTGEGGGGLRNFSASKNKLVSVIATECEGKNERWRYVQALSRHITVDVYGKCGRDVCPGHLTRDCNATKGYKFYLAFENSNCREYITEKLWWNSYAKEIVPVVMGASKEEYERVTPPYSFIHVQDFKNPAELAKYLWYLNSNASAYNEYFAWKNKYQVLNDHGFFGTQSQNLCRLCEALNRLRGKSKVYRDLGKFWNRATDCRAPLWVPK